MATFQDLTGLIFDRLKVIKRNGSLHGRPLWLCECSCGNFKSISANNLKSKKTKSCGCLKIETSSKSIKNIIGYNTLPKGEAVFNKMFISYKNSARKKKLIFNITKLEFKKFTENKCVYRDWETDRKSVV